MISCKFDESFFPKLKDWYALTSCYKECIDLMYEIPVIIRAKYILELGVGGYGISTTVFLKALEQTGGYLTSVDIDQNLKVENFPNFDRTKWSYINADDCSVKVVGAFDIVYIDTSHQYMHTKLELYKFVPILRKGGYLFVHDTNEPEVLQALTEYMNEFSGLLEIIHIENAIPTMTILIKNG